MTGILVRPVGSGGGALEPNPWASLDPAFSNRTREINQQIAALRSRPSPASLPTEAASMGEQPLQERLFDALAKAKILTSQVAMHLEREWKDRLFRQLDSLHDTEEWEAGDLPIEQSSFSTFLKAMLNINPERRPGLGLSSVGHLIAAWTTGQDRLTIEFLSNDRIRWVLSRHTDDDDTERFAGDTSVARLAEGLAAYHPEHWFSHVRTNHEPA
jgi:hypothetical protein